ncbi:phosphopantetheine-binding protein [Micromonospora sp. DT43]|uniref:phosphopantetheine-binding protein n=1 Tax=Micromonospora sp. DT43 TaxID=3393440 RepID=UPI003CFA14B4
MPRADAEQLVPTIVTIWSAIFKNQPITEDSDFFDLGGESLDLVRFLAEVQAEFGVDLPVTELFATTFSPATVAAAIERLRAEEELLDDLVRRLDELPPDEARRLLAEAE